MRPSKIIKLLIPVLLLATTFFSIYMPNAGDRAVNIFGLLPEMPLAIVVPLLFAGSILFAWFETKWSSVQSAVLAVLGIIAAFIVNGYTDTGGSTPEPYTSIAVLTYVIVAPVTYLCFLIRKLVHRNKKPVKAEAATPKAAPFLTMPVWRYALFMVISAGLYQLYWQYVNWNAVKTREGSAISPFWRAIFWIFWIYALYKKIIKQAGEHGHPSRFSAGALAGSYIALYIATIPLSLLLTYRQLWLASLVTLTMFLLITIPVQQAANAEKPADKLSAKGPTAGEFLILFFGALVFLINISTLAQKPNVTILEDISAQMSLVKQSIQLSVEYAQCHENLKQRFSLLDQTDQAAVDSFKSDHDKCEAVKLELDRVVKQQSQGGLKVGD